MDFYAVIPTYNRPAELLNLVTQLCDQNVDDILVINNGNPNDTEHLLDLNNSHVYYDSDPSPHIYGMWNFGLGFWHQETPHCVAVLNDDLELPDNFAHRMREVMSQPDAPTIAFPNQHGHQVNTHRKEPGRTLLTERVTGYCFVINPSHGILADEARFKWWYGDDDLDWQARHHYNGTYLVQDVTVNHLYPSQSTNESDERIAQAGRDRQEFIAKWGTAPW
jgi:GT2 family glycosyltransferase